MAGISYVFTLATAMGRTTAASAPGFSEAPTSEKVGAMTQQTSHKFSPEVCERAVRMVFDHQTEHSSQWGTITSIASKIGCNPETLRSWAARAGSPSAVVTGRDG